MKQSDHMSSEKKDESYFPLIKHEWFLGGIFGVVATIIGAGIAMWWDLHKEAKEEAEKSVVVFRIMDDEFKENMDVAKRNIKSLSEELGLLSKGRHIVQPLSLFRTGAWQMAILLVPDNPKKIEKLGGLRYLLTIINMCNEQISSRENFRLHNQPLSNFAEQMRIYDQQLLSELGLVEGFLQINAKTLEELLDPGQKPLHLQ